jgi:hypothetical protein
MTSKPWPGRPGWTRAWLSLCVSALLLGCGGGGEGGNSQAGVNTGGTGSFSSGPITGFGSIIVNGIHFDPNLATVTFADVPGVSSTPSVLKLGMVVELDASSVTAVPGKRVADVLAIKVSSQLLGPIEAKGADTLTVMGQTVRIRTDTHFDEALPQDLSSVNVGDVVEVHGFEDASTGEFVATRVERKDPTLVTQYVVRGVLRDLDLGLKRCRIGNQVLSYDWGSAPAGLGNGRVARAVLYPTPGTTSGTTPAALWTATKMTLSEPLVSDRGEAYVEGLVSDIAAGPVGHFSVDGIAVDASQAQCSPACSSLSLGSRVRVRGKLVSGVVVASEVSTAF